MSNFLSTPSAEEHRRSLEYAAMPDLARAVVEGGNAEKTGERVREAIDGLLGIRREAGQTARSHDSDCAVHNEPAMPAGPCDCGAAPAPRVTPADVEAAIASEHYYTAADGDFACRGQRPMALPDDPLALVLHCTIMTKNGQAVTGTAYCQDANNQDPEAARKSARADAIRQLWPMVIYAERERLAAPPSTKLTPTDVRWAEDLIRQLPADHEGRNSWLLNFGGAAPDARPNARAEA